MSLEACTMAWVDQRLNDGEFPVIARVSEDCKSNLNSDPNQICHLVRLKRSPIRKPEFQWVTLRFRREVNCCYRICDRLGCCDLGGGADTRAVDDAVTSATSQDQPEASQPAPAPRSLPKSRTGGGQRWSRRTQTRWVRHRAEFTKGRRD